jgi:hypothetical protein
MESTPCAKPINTNAIQYSLPILHSLPIPLPHSSVSSYPTFPNTRQPPSIVNSPALSYAAHGHIKCRWGRVTLCHCGQCYIIILHSVLLCPARGKAVRDGVFDNPSTRSRQKLGRAERECEGMCGARPSASAWCRAVRCREERKRMPQGCAESCGAGPNTSAWCKAVRGL